MPCRLLEETLGVCVVRGGSRWPRAAFLNTTGAWPQRAGPMHPASFPMKSRLYQNHLKECTRHSGRELAALATTGSVPER